MRVIVVGAGEVGSTTAEGLADDHEVVVIDTDPDRVDQLTYAVDALAIEGDGTDLDVLREAGIEDADMLIASTDSDETNIVACGTARTASDAFTIARVRRPALLRTWESSERAFGVDFMVSVELLTAERIVEIAGLPRTRDVDSFAGGLVRMAEFRIDDRDPLAGQTVDEADRYEELTFAALLRDDEVVVPTGSTRFHPGDDLVVIGRPRSCRAFATALAGDDALDGASDVVVVGGGSVGEQTARLFEHHGYRPRLVEHDADLARELAEKLPDTTVLSNDATDTDFLEREHVDDADLLVATLGSDERNLLVALLAKQLGVDRTVAVVESADNVDLFEAVGVDVAVNPRRVTAEEITRFTRLRRAENVAIIGGDRAEVIEVEVDADSVLVGRPIHESTADLPDSVVIGAITRDGGFVTPRGDTVVEAGDHVVVFVDTAVLEEVTARI